MSIIVTKPQIGNNAYSGWKNRIGSAGNVSVKFSIRNMSTKTIKYAVVYFTPFNRVGDAVKCSISGESTKAVKFTGPLRPMMTEKDIVFSDAWYNNTISGVVLDKVAVRYMDDTILEFNGKNVPSNIIGGLMKK